MGKKSKKHKINKNNMVEAQDIKKKVVPLISIIGKKVIFVGILMVIAGFYILTKADPLGQNAASKLSPSLLIFGYVLIGIGIVLPDKLPN